VNRRSVQLSVVSIALVSVLLAGCSKKSSTVTAATGSDSAVRALLPAAIRTAGEIKIGSDIEYAPIEFFKTGTQQVQGLDYDLAQAMGKKLGVKMTFINDTDFAGIIGAMTSNRFNIIMSAMNDTAERRGKGVDFIDYFKAGSSILVKKGNPKQIRNLDDLCGMTVAVQKGTTQENDILKPQQTVCSGRNKPINILGFEKDTDALQQVKNDRAVANLEDFPVAAYNAQTSGGGADFDVVAGQVGDQGSYGIAVPTAQTQLRDALQSALRAIIADGTYDRVLTKWSVTAGALKTALLNGGG
jgi:polar amino acid transport system substrate-binding protein